MKRKVEKLQKKFVKLKQVVKSPGMGNCQLSFHGRAFKTVSFGLFNSSSFFFTASVAN